jgi:hypothetical protein
MLLTFAPCFTVPSFENFAAIVCGWIVCQGRHTVTRAILGARALGLGRQHHSVFYRLLSRARWAVDDVGRALFTLLLPFLPPDVEAAVDDTLSHRSGPQIFGAGMHYDTARSTYGGAGGRQARFAFGHDWVVLSIWVPLPWNRTRGFSVPVLFRLYRPKRRCPKEAYRKKTELAGEMLRVLRSWLPADRTLHLTGDSEYACRTLLRDFPAGVEFNGPLSLNAALFELPPARRRGRGRPRRKGQQLPTPARSLRAKGGKWTRSRVILYGEEVTLEIRTFVCLWYTVRGMEPVRVVLTRDPRGRFQPRAFFCTNPDRDPAEILQRYSRRWPLESTFRTAKQVMGIEEPRNGWWRRPHGERRPRCKAGPQASKERGRRAVERTVPLLFIAYGLVFAWYLRHGDPAHDVARARRLRPWDRQKSEPSFDDMLAAMRRALWRERISEYPSLRALRMNNRALLPLQETAA